MNTNSYTVRMIVGNDKCTTVTPVDATSADDAILLAQMKWVGLTVRVINVLDNTGTCVDDVCRDDDHFCPTDDRHGHMQHDGTCADCDFD